MLNQTFLRAAGGLTETPCRWCVNRSSAQLVVDSFQLYFGHEKSSDFPDVFKTENEMRVYVHIRFVCTCNIFGARGVIVRMAYLPSRKVRWTNSTWNSIPSSAWSVMSTQKILYYCQPTMIHLLCLTSFCVCVNLSIMAAWALSPVQVRVDPPLSQVLHMHIELGQRTFSEGRKGMRMMTPRQESKL